MDSGPRSRAARLRTLGGVLILIGLLFLPSGLVRASAIEGVDAFFVLFRIAWYGFAIVTLGVFALRAGLLPAEGPRRAPALLASASGALLVFGDAACGLALARPGYEELAFAGVFAWGFGLLALIAGLLLLASRRGRLST